MWPYEDNIEQLSQHVVTSIHGETFSASMTNAIYRMRKLEGVVGTTTLANNDCFDGLETSIADQFHQVARLTKNRDGLEASRDVFYTSIGGFDTHSDNGDTLTGLLTEIDDAIGCFKTAMDDQGIWNNVTVSYYPDQSSFFLCAVFSHNLLYPLFIIFCRLCLHQNLAER